MYVHFDFLAGKALVAVYVVDHVLVLRRLHEAQILVVGAESVMKSDRHALRRAVRTDRIISTQVVRFEKISGNIPARFVEQLNAVKGGRCAVAFGKPSQYLDRMRYVFLACVPFADILDAAVVKAVLAAGSRVEVE